MTSACRKKWSAGFTKGFEKDFFPRGIRDVDSTRYNALVVSKIDVFLKSAFK